MLRQAWLNTNIERDKTIITLSSAGLALLANIALNATSQDLGFETVVFVGLLSFTISILAGVYCLHSNRRILETELDRDEENSSDVPDLLLLAGFVLGVLAFGVAGTLILTKP